MPAAVLAFGAATTPDSGARVAGSLRRETRRRSGPPGSTAAQPAPTLDGLSDSNFRVTSHGRREDLAAGGVQGDQLHRPQRRPGRLVDLWSPVSEVGTGLGSRCRQKVAPVVSIRNFIMGVSCLLGMAQRCCWTHHPVQPDTGPGASGGLKHTARLCKTVRRLAPSAYESGFDAADGAASWSTRQRSGRVGCAATAPHETTTAAPQRCRTLGVKLFALLVRFTILAGHEDGSTHWSPTLWPRSLQRNPTRPSIPATPRPEEPSLRVFYECYRKPCGIPAHEAAPHTRRFLSERTRYLARPAEVWTLAPVVGAINGTPLRGDGAPR